MVVVGSTARVRHSRMLKAGIQEFRTGPPINTFGGDNLGKVIRGPLDIPQLAVGYFISLELT